MKCTSMGTLFKKWLSRSSRCTTFLRGRCQARPTLSPNWPDEKEKELVGSENEALARPLEQASEALNQVWLAGRPLEATKAAMVFT